MSSYITRKQYEQAMEASDALAVAAELVMQASRKLDGVDARFMDKLNEIEGVDVISRELAHALDHLASQISLDADAAIESSND